MVQLSQPYMTTRKTIALTRWTFAKECSNYRTIALISHASKVMLKILQARLQQYVNRELADVQAGFRKRREVKGKGEKERYTHLNAEFLGIASRDKKAFLSDQCKEIEKNN